MLSEIDDFTEGNCKIKFNLAQKSTPPKDGWQLLGEQKIPPVKWLTKNYNKLGNFLHLAEPNKAKTFEGNELKEAISPMIAMLEDYVKGNFISSVNNFEIGKCPVCNKDFAFLTNKVKHNQVKKCDNFKCGALLCANVDTSSNKVTFISKVVEFNCQICHEIIIISEEKTRGLGSLECNNCSSKYIIRGEYKVALCSKES